MTADTYILLTDPKARGTTALNPYDAYEVTNVVPAFFLLSVCYSSYPCHIYCQLVICKLVLYSSLRLYSFFIYSRLQKA